MINSAVIVELQYLPCLEYFTLFERFDKIIIEQHEHFVKQSYRNRTHILSSNQVTALSIPVIGGNSKISINNIEMDCSQRWLTTHWKGIVSAYGKAPFFEHYSPLFEKIFYSKHQKLFEFNFELLTLCLKLLRYDHKLEFSEKYQKVLSGDIFDIRSVIHPKKKYQKNNFYKPNSYIQMFGKEFVANLSIIDLLFCEGPYARKILQQSSNSVVNK